MDTMLTTDDLLKRNCQPRVAGLSDAEIAPYLAAVDGWVLKDGKIVKTFAFKDYYRTMAFVNAMAYMIHAQDHHPELLVTYDRCIVMFSTHSVNNGNGGISENDFICAAKLDALHQQPAA
jgi:4a-hydroxytetrahydrobiopterin dehydratase